MLTDLVFEFKKSCEWLHSLIVDYIAAVNSSIQPNECQHKTANKHNTFEIIITISLKRTEASKSKFEVRAHVYHPCTVIDDH